MSSNAQRQPAFLKDYATVASRLEGFHDKYPDGRIITELLPRDDGLISFKAYVYVDGEAKEPSATGHSIDVLDINKSSFEKLETAAVGRALAFLGFGAKNISSAEEMERHESRQQQPQRQAVPLRSPASPDEQCEQIARGNSNEAIAKTMADLVTPKQLVAIRAITNANSINAESACLDRFACRPEELSRRVASEWIDELKSGDEHKPQATPVNRPAPVGMITDGQKSAIFSLAEKKSRDAQGLSHQLYGCDIDSLTTIQAATMIQEMQKG